MEKEKLAILETWKKKEIGKKRMLGKEKIEIWETGKRKVQ